MADKSITFSKSIVAQKDISGTDVPTYITQLSKPIILKGISTKTCQNVLYSIDGMNFTPETTIGDDNVLSMAIVPFYLGGPTIGSNGAYMSKSIIIKAFSYILGERNVNEDINIDSPISAPSDTHPTNGAYRYLLQYLADNKDKIWWDTGDLFSSLDANRQDSFGGSDFITDNITVLYKNGEHQLSIDIQTDANGYILKPQITMGAFSNNNITINQHNFFFLCPEACPASDDTEKLIIDNFWRGGGLLTSSMFRNYGIFMLYIFAVS